MDKKIKSIVKRVSALFIGAAAACSFGAANAAAMLGQAPDASLIVQAGSYEWVYAGPCAGEGSSCGPVSLHHEFGFATDKEWDASFSNLSALIAAFTLPDGRARCAASYFDLYYDECDSGDLNAGYLWHSPLATYTFLNSSAYAETFLVRAAAADPAAVPEPATLALVGLGLFGFAAARRHRSNR